MIHSASFLCSAYDDLSNVYWKGRAKAESGFKEWATSRVLCSIKKEKVILSVQSCQCRLPKQLLLDGMGCFYWLFRNSFKRLFSLNFTRTLTLRHWECHWQLPKSPVADSNLHRLFCILVYVERKGSNWSIFLSLHLFPYLLPAPFFQGWGNMTACLRRKKQICEALCCGIVLSWVYYAKEHSMNGDKSSSPTTQQPFPSENGILVQSWGCAEAPSLFQRIISPFPLLFS